MSESSVSSCFWTSSEYSSPSPPRRRPSPPMREPKFIGPREPERGIRMYDGLGRCCIDPIPVARRADDAMRNACRSHNFEMLDMLGDPVGNVAFGRGAMHRALVRAVRTGDGKTVDRLSFPPYSLGHSDAMARAGIAFRMACRKGWSGIVERFGMPPYSVVKSDAIAFGGVALLEACDCPSPEVVRLLGRAPFSIRRGDVEYAAILSAARDPGIIAALLEMLI